MRHIRQNTRRWRSLCGVLVALMLLLPAPFLVRAQPAPNATAALDWLRGQQNTDGGFSGLNGPGSDPGTSADAALAFLSAAVPLDTVRREGGANLRDYLRDSGGNLSVGQGAKVVLAIAATGEDPGVFRLGTVYDGILAQFIAPAEPSTFVRALVILAVTATEGPERAAQLDGGVLRRAQGVDGGWAFAPRGESSDTNTTALVVQALVASGQGGDATTRGMAYLEGTRAGNDLYPFDGGSGEGDANSTAYVLQAKIAARADPAEIERTLRALRTLQQPSGAFAFQVSAPDDNLLATLQAVPALGGRAFPGVRPAVVMPSLPVAA